MKFSKESQIYDQIFIYLLTIILVSFILVYGYNAVKDFRTRTDAISCLKFKNDLSNAVESILSDFGSVKRKDFHVCSDYKQVCFIETFTEFNRDSPQSNMIPINPIVKDSIKSSVDSNVFLINDLPESFYIGNISVDADIFCINAVSKLISLRLEGRGSHVLLSQWS